MLVLLLVLGLVLLVVGGEVLVRGAGGLAREIGLSPLVVGLTVVSAATSAPEFSVTLQATLGGAPGLAVGNVVGSNIANVLLVLGIAALVTPLVVTRQTMRLDLPVVLALSALAWLLVLDGSLSRLEGGVLLVVAVAYVAASVVRSRRARSTGHDGDEHPEEKPSRWRPRSRGARAAVDVALLAVGVGLLVLGARFLVSAATDIATGLGVSDLVIGLTVVAVGTSLPELATSVVAVARGQRDLAVGNVVGSNLFNLGAVLGLTGVLTPGGVPVGTSSVQVDLPVMIGSVVLLLALAYVSRSVSRRDGALMLAVYVAYLAHLVLDATDNAAVGSFVQVVTVVGGLVAVAVPVLVVREARRRRRHPAPA